MKKFNITIVLRDGARFNLIEFSENDLNSVEKAIKEKDYLIITQKSEKVLIPFHSISLIKANEVQA